MMVSHRHRCIFSHAPKCAGTSIRNLLKLEFISPPYWHCTWEDGEARLGADVLRGYFKFAVVRNPWDRVVSSWRMFHEKEWCRQPRDYTLGEFLDVVEDESIPFLARYRNEAEQDAWQRSVENIRHHSLPCLHPYYGLVDAGGNLAVDYVIRFERIDSGFRTVMGCLGIKGLRLPKENSTEHRHYSAYFDSKSRVRVEKLYAREIALFGYRFESGVGL